MVELLGGSATDRRGKEVGGLGPEAMAVLEQKHHNHPETCVINSLVAA